MCMWACKHMGVYFVSVGVFILNKGVHNHKEEKRLTIRPQYNTTQI